MSRTTLSVDPRVLAVARARVAAGLNASVGEAVSELALAGIDATARTSSSPDDEYDGLLLIPSDPDAPVVTDEMVADALDED
jgi:hypothetical protein